MAALDMNYPDSNNAPAAKQKDGPPPMFDDLQAVRTTPAHRQLLKATRTAKKISQAEAAKAGRVTQSAYSQIENGETNPKFCVLERICNHLGLTLTVTQVTEIVPTEAAREATAQ